MSYDRNLQSTKYKVNTFFLQDGKNLHASYAKYVLFSDFSVFLSIRPFPTR